MEAALSDGVDFALASRAMPDSNVEIHQAWYRETMGKTFNGIMRGITGIPIRDTQCGFKLLRGEDARALAREMQEDGFSFDVEALYVARRLGLRIVEVPVVWRNDEASRVSLGGGGAAFVDLIRIRLLAGRGAYGSSAPSGNAGGDPGPST